MRKRILSLLLAALLVLGLLTACGSVTDSQVQDAAGDLLTLVEEVDQQLDQEFSDSTEPDTQVTKEAAAPAADAEEPASEPEDADEMPLDLETDAGEQTSAPLGDAPQEESAGETVQSAAIDEDGEYTAPEDVAEYIHLYGKLPANFITKNAARDLGWDNSRGNLWDVAPGKSIGGDRFGNYEGLLPDTTKYRECDVNYTGGYRGAERLIYGEDGSIYYTNDHYSSFTRLY